MTERTLVLLKPDTIKRGVAGKIISRFEEAGLKIVAMKMVWADEELAQTHYKLDEVWAKNVFDKTKSAYEKDGKQMQYKDHLEFGKTIQRWNMNFLTEGPVIAMALEGPHAVEIVRKMVGSTEPRQAAPGTIRGDFATVESYAVADSKKRVLRNLIHASDTPENGVREIELWFSLNEIHPNYKTLHEVGRGE
jgi:nucleoside-diphosphate kinase